MNKTNLMKLKDGDRIVVTGNQDGNAELIGRVGIVRRTYDATKEIGYDIGAEFRKNYGKRLHRLSIGTPDCIGAILPRLSQDRGFWLMAKNFQKAPALKKRG